MLLIRAGWLVSIPAHYQGYQTTITAAALMAGFSHVALEGHCTPYCDTVPPCSEGLNVPTVPQYFRDYKV